MSQAAARGHVDEMRAALADDDVRVVQTSADERLEFEAVYGEFGAFAPPEVETDYDGQGWVEYRYAADGEVVGELSFVVGRASLTDEAGRHAYTLNVDRTGGVGVTVVGPAGTETPDDELRESVRQRFAEVGIPPRRPTNSCSSTTAACGDSTGYASVRMGTVFGAITRVRVDYTSSHTQTDSGRCCLLSR